jgi:hypothetical protein
MPLALAFLSVPLGPLAMRAWRSREPRPLLLGAVGGAVLLWGKYASEWFLLCAGMGLLMAASIWGSGFKLLRKPSRV